MITENPVLSEANCDLHNCPRICWSAVFSGAIVGVGLGFLLHLFSIAIGLSAYSATTDGATAIAIGGILGLLIGVIVSMGVAGFVTGYLGRSHFYHCHGGVIYGFITWSIALLLSAVFILPLTYYISAYTQNLNQAAIISKPAMHVLGNDSTTVDSASPTLRYEQGTLKQAAPTETEKDALAGGAWMVFILFFIGALSSCIGACCAMNCKRHQVTASRNL